MPLVAGTKLGPYEILAPLGAGGMGEVYRARDTRLGREVAIKVSAQQFSERFEREARAVAALNHPNICHLYDVGPNYLVMELVEGESPKGPLPVDEALAIAWQIADALEAAHEKGITHRDLKPANIKVKSDGTVKVLDFGLAKVAAASTSDGENSPTLTLGATFAGMILGTPGYMSPEQARGKPVDKRADIWSFGVVLYELLTGERMFEGETVSDTLAQVLTKEPDLAKVPVKVRKLVGRCLQKDPKHRLRDIGEARFWLDTPTPTVSSERGWLARTRWIAAGALGLIAAVTGFLWIRERPQETLQLMRFEIAPPAGTTVGSVPIISPDGQTVAFIATSASGKRMLYVRPLNSAEARVLPGTDDAIYAFWSPDGRSLGFTAGAGVNSNLKRIDVAGAGPRVLTSDARGDNGTWNQFGDILFYLPPQIFRVSASGGPITAVARLDAKKGESSHRFPQFLADGKHFLFFAFGNDPSHNTIEFATLGSFDRKTVLEGVSAGIYGRGSNGDAYLLYQRDQTLLAQRFDESAGVMLDEPAVIADDVAAVAQNRRFPAVSASWNGRLVYRTGSSGAFYQLTWLDRQGHVIGTVGEPARYNDAVLSPDGTRVAVSRQGPNADSDLWLLDLGRNIPSRFTSDPSPDRYPVWSPGGDRIVFASLRNGHLDLYWKPSDGSRSEELLFASEDDKVPTSWSRDGRFLLYHTSGSLRIGNDLWALPLEGDRKPWLVLGTKFNESWGRFSPDGHWIAYYSNESGSNEIYVRPFTPPGSKTPPPETTVRISKNGGILPRWRDDGKEIVFFAPMQDTVELTSAEVTTSPTFRAGVPKRLFFAQTNPSNATNSGPGDFKRFLIITPPPQNAPAAQPITLVLNWTEALKK
jgi:Tol biopolymer transport system component/predicted Ser/Thr protein kinase